jgi:cyclase
VTERDPVRWSKRLVEAGAGELLVTAVDRDGTMSGLDRALLAWFAGEISVPVVGAGGASSVDDLCETLRTCRLSGIAVGARFVYQGPHRAVLISYPSREEMDRVQRAARG